MTMKKMLFCFLILISGHAYGQFYPGEVFYLSGTSQKGYINPPDVFDKNVKIKNNEYGVAQKIKSADLSHIIFETRDGGSLEIRRITPTLGMKGWADVIVKGPMSLYKYMKIEQKKGMMGGREESKVPYYYCKRETEIKSSCLYPNILFTKTTAKYFSDYPELADKIRDKQEGYRWYDLDHIVTEYNEWKNNK